MMYMKKTRAGGSASQKQQVREEVKRKKLSVGENLIPFSQSVIENLESLAVFPTIPVPSILYFAGKPQTFEVQTLPHVQDLIQRGFLVWLPKTIVADKSLQWGLIQNIDLDLELGAFSVPEPRDDVIQRNDMDFSQIDLAIVPGVAFDERGHRMGYGQGYYDRFLEIAPLNCPVVGLAFEFQVFPEIPFESHDSVVNYIVTETRVREIKKKEL